MTDSFGSRIATRRAELGLTQRELAEKSGVSWSQISRYESDQASPRLKVIMKLADALGLNVDDLQHALSKKSSKLKIYEGFSSRLVTARSNALISKKKLSTATGISQDDLADLELGLLLPSADDVVKISKALGVSLDSLAGTKDEEEAVLLHFVEPGDDSAGTRESLVPVNPEAYRYFVNIAEKFGITPGEMMSALVFREAALIDKKPDEVPPLSDFVEKIKTKSL